MPEVVTITPPLISVGECGPGLQISTKTLAEYFGSVVKVKVKVKVKDYSKHE